VWQRLREELHPKGLEIVTVALDTEGAEAARPYVEAAGSRHPSLVDVGHVLDELLGVVNVPEGVWIDEEGILVRPPEPAAPQSVAAMMPAIEFPPGTPPRVLAMVEESYKIKNGSEKYIPALRDWVEHGADSRYALSPDELVRRSRPRPPEIARASACFELAQYLHREGHVDDAVPWFREAHRLQPANWTYRRQAWHLAAPLQAGPDTGARDAWPYDSDWLTDARKVGPANYYELPSDL